MIDLAQQEAQSGLLCLQCSGLIVCHHITFTILARVEGDCEGPAADIKRAMLQRSVLVVWVLLPTTIRAQCNTLQLQDHKRGGT